MGKRRGSSRLSGCCQVAASRWVRSAWVSSATRARRVGIPSLPVSLVRKKGPIPRFLAMCYCSCAGMGCTMAAQGGAFGAPVQLAHGHAAVTGAQCMVCMLGPPVTALKNDRHERRLKEWSTHALFAFSHAPLSPPHTHTHPCTKQQCSRQQSCAQTCHDTHVQAWCDGLQQLAASSHTPIAMCGSPSCLKPGR
jgi:hypothetical protein